MDRLEPRRRPACGEAARFFLPSSLPLHPHPSDSLHSPRFLPWRLPSRRDVTWRTADINKPPRQKLMRTEVSFLFPSFFPAEETSLSSAFKDFRGGGIARRSLRVKVREKQWVRFLPTSRVRLHSKKRVNPVVLPSNARFTSRFSDYQTLFERGDFARVFI